MTRLLYLVRHGQTDWNAQGLIQGHQGVGLNDVGRAQVELLVATVQSWRVSFNFLACSDQERALQTARPLQALLGIPLVVDERLRECCFGMIEGKTRATAISLYPNLAPHFDHYDHEYDFRSVGGERRVWVLERHVSFLRQYAFEIHRGLIVGHGRSLNTLMYGRWPHARPLKKNCEWAVGSLELLLSNR